MKSKQQPERKQEDFQNNSSGQWELKEFFFKDSGL